ncbi:serine aminopeptidase domain-containing protein [Rivihabitans pingtungensis]|uniref:serine aminopeptidase domain-containing protein n=1 Tax=Rivihabitans pingtungensis TaxID=1054498 RepID=UPI003570A859
MILGDLASGLARATEAFPKSPVFLFGHSAGGALALHLAQFHLERFEIVAAIEQFLEEAHAYAPAFCSYLTSPSFPRRRESIFSLPILDARLRGHDRNQPQSTGPSREGA